jgi:hypothetical protein
MGPHYVNHCVAAKLPETVGTDNCVFMPVPYIVYTRLELDHIVKMRSVCSRPIHLAADATEWESSRGIAARQLFKRRDHAVRIEVAIREIDISIDAKFQLSALLRSRRIDPCLNQALEVVLTLIRIDDMNCLMPTLESVFYEWQQNPILFVWAVEERADVTRLVDLGTSKRNGSRDLLHSISPKR